MKKILFLLVLGFLFNFFLVGSINAVEGCTCTLNVTGSSFLGSCSINGSATFPFGTSLTISDILSKVSTEDCSIASTVSSFFTETYQLTAENCNSTKFSFSQSGYEGSVNCVGESKAGDSTSSTIVLPADIKKLDQLGLKGVEGVNTLIGRALKTGMGVLGSVALIMFLYGGVLWMISSGNSEKTKQAIDIIVWASLGVIVILASYGIVEFVFKAFQ